MGWGPRKGGREWERAVRNVGSAFWGDCAELSLGRCHVFDWDAGVGVLV